VCNQLYLSFDDTTEKRINPFFIPTSYETEIINALHQSLQSEFALIRMTSTMLEKSIIDASESIRFILSEAKIVDFSEINQGEKVLADAVVLTAEGYKESKVSYYRPNTKSGDPRFCIYGFKKLVEEGTLVFFTIKQGKLLVVPVMPLSIRKEKTLEKKKYSEKLEDDIDQFSEEPISNFETLRRSVSEIKTRGWIESVQPHRLSPKDVGLTLEHALGISANVDRGADFLGEIEIKSTLENTTTTTLFSKVPNWKLSEYKSAADLMLKFGYTSQKHPGFIDLYVTVSNKPNRQGLFLAADYSGDCLFQKYKTEDQESDVCLWEFTTLKNALWNKHPSTLWVDAEKKQRGGVYYFRYVKASFSKKPVFSQFINLISQGIVTYDWRGKVKPDRTKYRDHGHCFRIKSNSKRLLFSSEKEVHLDWQ